MSNNILIQLLNSNSIFISGMTVVALSGLILVVAGLIMSYVNARKKVKND